MSTAAVNNILRIPGRLKVNGVEAGVVRVVEVRFLPAYHPIHAEEWGQQIADVVYAGEKAIIAGIMRSWDAALIGALFPSGSALYNPVSGTRPGTLLSTKAVAITFTPRASAHPSVSFPSAVPLIEETATMQFSFEREIGLAFAFLGLPDGSGKVYQIG